NADRDAGRSTLALGGSARRTRDHVQTVLDSSRITGGHMRAVTFSRLGGPEVLEVSELPVPQPGPGEVRIRVAAATVNPTDISFRWGGQSPPPRLAEMGVVPPSIPGMELAGVIDAVAQDAPWRVGDRVMAIVNPRRPGGGAQAEKVVVPAA